MDQEKCEEISPGTLLVEWLDNFFLFVVMSVLFILIFSL